MFQRGSKTTSTLWMRVYSGIHRRTPGQQLADLSTRRVCQVHQAPSTWPGRTKEVRLQTGRFTAHQLKISYHRQVHAGS